MSLSRRHLLKQAGAGAALAATPAAARGGERFEPSWDSLNAGYRAPDWFRDAKLGIWSHWGPQCVPEFGDWYGRLMYAQGSPAYDHHLRTLGHPSKTGFIDIIGQWTAERWDPEGLMDLYQAAGARYFVSMANHHDNLDMYASAHHPWNTLRVGPRRDIVGEWAGVARRRGLRFGVSNHSAHAWHWWQTAYGYDAEGPLKGVRYDAHRLTRADGKGTWWEGLDPQALYTGPSMAPPDGINSTAAMNAWHDAHDGQWIETPPPADPAYAANWALRCRDLIDRYRPDLVYFDNYGLPLGQAGLDVTAYYYNASRAWNGRLDAVVNGKRLAPAQRKGIVETVERGFSDTLRPEPWQTDTCIGDWHYNRARYTERSYVDARSVIQRLCDVVAKNGNLLLSIPQRGDGSIDSEERKILSAMAAWIAVNGEAIYGSRPWTIYGEGPTRVAAGMQTEGTAAGFGAGDVRFTTRGGALYAILLDWPAHRNVTIRALGAGSTHAPGRVERVELLGAAGPLTFSRGAEGLTVALPGTRPVDWAPVLRISGAGLVGQAMRGG
jgi:alpha-L-fucosidase